EFPNKTCHFQVIVMDILTVGIANEIPSVFVVYVAIAILVRSGGRTVFFVDPDDVFQVFMVYVDPSIDDGYHHGSALLTVEQLFIRFFGTDAHYAVAFVIEIKPICRWGIFCLSERNYRKQDDE